MYPLPAPLRPVGVGAESVYEDPRNDGYVPIEDIAPKPLVDELCRRYPVLGERPDYLRFTVHVLNAAVAEGGFVATPVPYDFLGAIVGKANQAASRNFEAGDFLDGYKRAMAAASASHREPFDVSFSGYREGECRRVRSLSVPSDLRRAVLDFHTHPFGHDLVRVTPSGAVTLNERAIRRHRTARIAAVEPHSNSPALARDLLGYLNGLPLQPFTRVADPEALEAALRYAGREYADAPAKLQYVRRVLTAVSLQPMPIYRTSANTVRVFAEGHSLASLPTPLRRLLSERAGWVELDLEHSQLAIGAALWKVEPVVEMLSGNDFDVWDDLIRRLGLDPEALLRDDHALYRRVKAALKPNVYGILFGASRHDLARFGFAYDFDPSRTDRAVVKRRELLTWMFGRPLDALGEAFLAHPLMAAMLEARERRMAEVMATGYLLDAFARKLALRKDEAHGATVRSLLAQEAQAMELKLLEPVIRAAIAETEKKRPNWRIVLWQHDGFSLWVKEDRLVAFTVAILQDLVREAARAEGVPTQLVVKG